MTAFQLHPQLAADTHPVASLTQCELRLHKNALWPWFILVPRIAGAVELHRLPSAQYQKCWEEVRLVSEFTASLPAVEKINTGALGNVVPQLHLHVVGRSKRDPAWPGPVWGFHFEGETAVYSPTEIQELASLWNQFAGQKHGNS